MSTAKRLMLISGIISFVLGILLLTGRLPVQQIEARVLHEGNAFYHEENYEKALTIYSDGLNRLKKSEAIAYNLGMTQYQLGDYAAAVGNFQTSEANALVLGNTYYELGQQQNGQEQMTSYQAAVDTYFAGIVKEPERFDLKFNYEFVKKLLDQQNQDQQNQDQQNQDQQNQDQQNQDQQNQDQQNQDQQNQDQQNQDQQNQDQQNQDQQNQDQQNLDQQSQDQNAIDQILQALEQQEENSLKNNQEIIDKGTVDTHDW